jgi:hypothetical protein
MTAANNWLERSLLHAHDQGALILLGPGVDAPLPPAAARRHVPGGTLVALAEGARLADPRRPIVAFGGDSDMYGAGLGDLLHAARRNTDLTVLVLENGLAEGGAAPSTAEGPYPLSPLALVTAAGATLVAQELPHENVAGLTERAIQHPGFALINVHHTPEPDESISLEDVPDYDRYSRREALEFAADPEGIYRGVLFADPDRQAFESLVLGQAPAVTTVNTTDWSGWEYILFGDEGEEDDTHGGSEPDGAGA